MNLSVIINTSSLGPRAREVTGSWTFTPHSARAYALHEFILPFYVLNADIKEVIVVGEYMEGDGYTYIHSPSKYFSCVDAVRQRQLGAEASTGDWTVFHHDDHFLDYTFASRFNAAKQLSSIDVVLPERRRRLPKGGFETLNNGKDDNYIGGHCLAMSRKALERAPWSEVQELIEWDVSLTRLLVAADLKAMWTDSVWCWDVEVGGDNERPVTWYERPDPHALV